MLISERIANTFNPHGPASFEPEIGAVDLEPPHPCLMRPVALGPPEAAVELK
jgi:hypothetical protein